MGVGEGGYVKGHILAGPLLDDEEGSQDGNPDGGGVCEDHGIIQGQELHGPEVAANCPKAKQTSYQQQAAPAQSTHTM